MSKKEEVRKPERAIAFARAASRTQDGDDSILLQYKEIEKYAAENNIEIVGWVEIIGSGWQSNLDELLVAVDKQSSVDKVLVHSIQRLTRVRDEFHHIKQELAARNVAIGSVTEPLDNSLLEYLYLFNLAGQAESDFRAEMISRAMARKAKQGYQLSKPPLGYSKGDIEGIYEINNDGRALQTGFQDVLSGSMTMPELREKVSLIYFPFWESNEKIIAKKHFEKIVSNPYYAGFVKYDGKVYKGLHKPLLTPEEQEKLKGLLDS